MNPRRLVVNADDFGLSPGVNEGVVTAHERGIVTTASLMVAGERVGDAAAYARTTPSLGVGLHVDLGEWAFSDGEWKPRYERVDLGDATAVGSEVRRQLAHFCRMVGRAPTHLDSHQHVHQREPAQSLLRRLASELGVPLRHESATVRYCGDFYGQSETGEPYPDAISVESLLAILASLEVGTTELCCHPAASADVDTAYAYERMIELQSLCDPRVRDAIASSHIELVDFTGRARDTRAER
jgi:predicted glycoside hydrolase/deacetylase ChbG (UPF0249 family)